MVKTLRDTTRAGFINKGSELTHAEMDANFIDLYIDQSSYNNDTAFTATSSHAGGTIIVTTGNDITVDGTSFEDGQSMFIANNSNTDFNAKVTVVGFDECRVVSSDGEITTNVIMVGQKGTSLRLLTTVQGGLKVLSIFTTNAKDFIFGNPVGTIDDPFTHADQAYLATSSGLHYFDDGVYQYATHIEANEDGGGWIAAAVVPYGYALGDGNGLSTSLPQSSPTTQVLPATHVERLVSQLGVDQVMITSIRSITGAATTAHERSVVSIRGADSDYLINRFRQRLDLRGKPAVSASPENYFTGNTTSLYTASSSIGGLGDWVSNSLYSSSNNAASAFFSSTRTNWDYMSIKKNESYILFARSTNLGRGSTSSTASPA